MYKFSLWYHFFINENSFNEEDNLSYYVNWKCKNINYIKTHHRRGRISDVPFVLAYKISGCLSWPLWFTPMYYMWRYIIEIKNV